MRTPPAHFGKSAAVSVGFFLLTAQLVFIRSLLELFQGNELTIGLALGLWLLGSASGSLWLGNVFRVFNRWHWLVLWVFPVTLFDFVSIKFFPRLLGFFPGNPQPFLLVFMVFSLCHYPGFPAGRGPVSVAGGTPHAERTFPANTFSEKSLHLGKPGRTAGSAGSQFPLIPPPAQFPGSADRTGGVLRTAALTPQDHTGSHRQPGCFLSCISCC